MIQIEWGRGTFLNIAIYISNKNVLRKKAYNSNNINRKKWRSNGNTNKLTNKTTTTTTTTTTTNTDIGKSSK